MYCVVEIVIIIVYFGKFLVFDLEVYLVSGELLWVVGGFILDGLGGWFIDGV